MTTVVGEHRPRNWKCAVAGHRIRFDAHDNTMTWACEWCGGHTGSKVYESAAAARRYAQAFDRRDEDIGKRAPLLGMFPLRLWRFLRNRKEHTE